MNIKVLIAAKGNSKRVKNKNLAPFYKSNLLELKLVQLKRIFKCNDIIVNSESDEIINIAKKHGVSIVKRDEYYTHDNVPMSEVYKNMAENIDSEYIAYINITNPLVKDSSYRKAIKLFKYKYGDIDSLVSCHDIKEFMWLNNKPLNYDTTKQVRSQDLPDIVALNFAISIISKEDMIRYKNIIGIHPYFFKLDEEESIDIDTNLDFFISEKLYEKNNL
jgi:CMP-N-acetylneuraminic acid synthetase